MFRLENSIRQRNTTSGSSEPTGIRMPSPVLQGVFDEALLFHVHALLALHKQVELVEAAWHEPEAVPALHLAHHVLLRGRLDVARPQHLFCCWSGAKQKTSKVQPLFLFFLAKVNPDDVARMSK